MRKSAGVCRLTEVLYSDGGETEITRLAKIVADLVLERIAPHLECIAVPPPEYISLAGAATLTGFSYDFIYDAVQRGELPAVKKGREWRVKAADVRDWMERDRGGRLAVPRS